MNFGNRSTHRALAIGLGLVLTSPVAMGASCPDVDGNGQVDVNDLLGLISSWGPCAVPEGCSADFDGDDAVGVNDLLALIGGWGPCPEESGPFNYGKALQAAVLFYEAQRAGPRAEDARLSWRGDAFMQVGSEQVNGQYDVDLRRRYMDAGDSPTFVLPISSAMTLMAWSGLEYEDGYIATGQMEHLHRNLRWHADWCIEAHPEPNVFCGQIGQGNASHAYWVPGEVYPASYTPKIWWLNADNPGSEPPAEAAAFLAAASMLFRDSDPSYADTLLQHARELHDFADQHRLEYHLTITDVSSFYRSWSGYHDELCWSALWLHRATGEASYLEKAEAIYDQHFLYGNKKWTHAWDDKSYGCMVLLSALSDRPVYREEAEAWLDYWTVGTAAGRIGHTPGGLAWLDTWGSLRYAANTAFMAFAYCDLVGDKPDGRYRAFAERQINYILGDNPRQASYICGFGEQPPVQPHHRTAHGSWNDQLDDPAPNRHVLWGALVGGPASLDDFDYADVRNDYIANEVACDYNAGLTGALARMASVYGGTPYPEAEFPPVESSYGKEMFVEASVIEDAETFTTIRCMLNNRSAWPARGSDAMSFHVYVDLGEVFAAGFDAGDVSVDSGFTDGATVSGLQPVDGQPQLYFIEVDYAGSLIVPGPGTSHRRECQLTIGLPADAPSGAWSRTNDPSLTGLPVGQSSITRTEMMPVFDAGVLIYGEEGVFDCNDNGIDDAQEIADGAPDLDGNGRPDECDPDCNGDGAPDAWEIAEGDAVDCNGNGVPDACDIADGDAADADGDGIPDPCQLEGVLWTMDVDNQWDGGFVAEFTITNQSGAPIESWRLEMQADFGATNVWNAVLVEQQGGLSVIEHEAWNPTIPEGGSIQFGLQGTGTPVAPGSISVNGIPAEQG